MALKLFEALSLITQNAPKVGTHIVPIEQAIGQVCARTLHAHYDLPRFDNSAMDGYGVTNDQEDTTLPIQEVVFAGDKAPKALQKGYAIKIMTGAPIPQGVETIVPIEQTQQHEDKVILPAKISKNTFIRYKGEDVQKGSLLIDKGEMINAYHVGLLASQGITHIAVYRNIRVAVFGTGNELKAHYETISENELFNSNTPMFLSRSMQLGCKTSFIQNSADNIDELSRAIEEALQGDIIITSGGISMGDHDFTQEAFEAMGATILFQGVDIKPGRPTTIAIKDRTLIINLPGNPLAAMVNFEIFVTTAIRTMQGSISPAPFMFHAPIATPIHIKPGTTNIKLGILSKDGAFYPLAKQKPGMISPLPKAQYLALIDTDKQELQANEPVLVMPLGHC